MSGRAPGALDAHLVVRRDAFDLDLALRVEPGEVLALVGPNGSGKSTVLGALAGLVPLAAGHVRVGDRVLDDDATHVPAEGRGCGVVFQDHRLVAHLSARENVAFGLRARGVRAAEARERADGWLERLGLAAHRDVRAGRLSGGQAQRVALARALAVDPDVLLLDEPFAALDARTRVAVRDVVRAELAARPRPVLLVTHDPADSADLAGRVVALSGGRVAAGAWGHGPHAGAGAATGRDDAAPRDVVHDPVGVVVLTGGTARRMGGVDKTALDVGGVPIVDRVLAGVAPLPTVVVGDPPADRDRRPAHVRWVREEPAGSGPAAALAAGVRALGGVDVVVALAGDQPFAAQVVPRLVAALAARPAAGAALATTDRDQPLLAAYRVAALGPWLARVRPGDRVRGVLDGLDVVRVPVGAEALDVDDAADLERARREARPT